MITELILLPFKLLFLALINLMPTMQEVPLPDGIMTWFSNTLSLVAYILPVPDMLIIFGLWVLFVFFKFNWRLLQRIWDALPLT